MPISMQDVWLNKGGKGVALDSGVLECYGLSDIGYCASQWWKIEKLDNALYGISTVLHCMYLDKQQFVDFKGRLMKGVIAINYLPNFYF